MNSNGARLGDMPNANGERLLPLSISLLMIGGIFLIIGNAISLWANLRELERTTSGVNNTSTVIRLLHEIELSIVDAELAQRAFFTTNNRGLLDPLNRADETLAVLLASLNPIISNTQAQRDSLSKLRALTKIRLASMRARNAMFDSGERTRAIEEAHTQGAAQTHEIRQVVAVMMAQEQRLHRERVARTHRAQLRTKALAGALSIAILMLVALTYFLIRRNMRRRETAERELQKLNEQLESIVAKRTAQLSQLSWQLQTVTEREKMTLANELHDELGANLTAMNLDIAAVAKRLQTVEPALAGRLQRALKILHETVELKRRVIHGLRPSLLDTLGIGAALRALCEEYSTRTGRPCHVNIAENVGDLDPEWPIAIYRIAQECLTNVTKHADANSVHVTMIREAEGVRLRVVDDGVGIGRDSFDKPGSHGLRGIRERVRQFGGLFVVRQNERGKGTVAEAFLPFPGLAPAP